MKLVIATPLYPPEIGGPATYARLLEEGLPGKGMDVEVVKFSEVRHLPKFFRNYAYYRRVCRAARKADAVLALDPVSVGFPAMKAARKAGKPFLVKIVGDYAWEQGQQRFGITQNLDEFVRMQSVPLPVRIFRKIQTQVAHSAAKIIVPSEYLKGIVATWGIPREKIEVIYNAVTLENPGTVPESIARLERPVVLTAGRFVPWKGIGGVIEAVSRLSQVSLVIVGDGPDREALVTQAHEQIPNRVVFAGTLSHKDMLAAIRFADVFVLNSSYEGLSHLLIEAQAFGAPIVATAVGGNAEVVTDGENGLLIPAGDTSALVSAITRILGDDDFRTRVSARARESAEHFSVETMLSATVAALKNI